MRVCQSVSQAGLGLLGGKTERKAQHHNIPLHPKCGVQGTGVTQMSTNEGYDVGGVADAPMTETGRGGWTTHHSSLTSPLGVGRSQIKAGELRVCVMLVLFLTGLAGLIHAALLGKESIDLGGLGGPWPRPWGL